MVLLLELITRAHAPVEAIHGEVIIPLRPMPRPALGPPTIRAIPVPRVQDGLLEVSRPAENDPLTPLS